MKIRYTDSYITPREEVEKIKMLLEYVSHGRYSSKEVRKKAHILGETSYLASAYNHFMDRYAFLGCILHKHGRELRFNEKAIELIMEGVTKVKKYAPKVKQAT